MVAKIRWSMAKQRHYDKGRDLGAKKYENLEDQEKLEIEKQEANLRRIFDHKSRTINITKRSINDSEQNSKISLPIQLETMDKAFVNVRRDRNENIIICEELYITKLFIFKQIM